jgi:diacylglycerol kinase (ATP)
MFRPSPSRTPSQAEPATESEATEPEAAESARRASARVDIVVNRLARHLAKDGAIMRAITHAAGGDATIHETRSIAELDAVARDLARRRASRVVLAGGDGSYMAGVTALARAFGEDALPEIALAPGGTVSTVARNFARADTPWHGVGQSMAKRAARVVDAAIRGSGRVVPHPTLRVGDSLGFIFGAGLVASFFDEYYASTRQGYVGAAAIVARIFGGSFVGSALARRVLDPQPCTLTVDGATLAPRAFSLITASVVRNLGLHMLVTYRAGESDDRIHVVASPLGAMALGPQMPLVLAGRRLRGRNHVDALVRELVVRFPRESSYVLDGEVIRAREVKVSRGPTIMLRNP